VPKDTNCDKLKITWCKNNGDWYIACSRYPEIRGSGSPFDMIDNVEKWEIECIKMNSEKGRKNSIDIKKTMSIVSNKSKKIIDIINS